MTMINNLATKNMNRFLHSRNSFFSLLIFVFSFLVLSNNEAYGQLSITTEGTPFTIDFDGTVSGVNNGQFAGSGFQPSPSSGMLDSDAFSTTGLSDGDLGFGGTGTTGDYARGTSTGGETDGGIYGFEVASSDFTLGFQASIADLTPGEIILRMTNNTGVDIVTIDISYEIWEFNDQNISTSLNFSHSPDNTAYTSVGSLDFASVQAATAPFPPFFPGPQWQMVTRSYSIDISGSPLTNGNDFYLKWSTDDNTGSGSRDEIALDDISITMNEPPVPDTDTEALSIGFQSGAIDISSLNTTEVDASEVFWFTITDMGTADGLDTRIQTIRFVPGANNNVSWSSQIQNMRIDDFIGSFYTILSTDITDTYIDLTFAANEMNVPDGGTLNFRVWTYLNTTGIVDGGLLEFQIDTDAIGFSTYSNSSEFASSFPSVITSNTHTITVDATELRFVQQPIDANTNTPMATDISVEATDVNGSRDLDFVDNVDVSSDGTMTGDPIGVSAVAGLATWLESTDPITHTVAATGRMLTASSGILTDATSNTFDIIQGADRVEIASQPTQGQTNQVIGSIVVRALLPDLSLDTNYTGTLSISKNSGPGIISGTLTKVAVGGVATFDDITIDADGDYTILASGEVFMTTATSANIHIGTFFQDFSTCPPAGWLSVLINGNDWSCGLGYASVNGLGGSGASEAWYIMPSIDFSTLSNEVLTFDSWTSGTDITHPRLEVLYSVDYLGTGNPNVASWTSVDYGPPVEDSQVWVSSGLVDLSSIPSAAYVAFRYTSSGTTAGAATEWRIDNVSITETGCATPATQASSLTFSNVMINNMDLIWDNGNGTGRIVIARLGSAVTEIPVDGTNYTADAAYGTPAAAFGSSFVVYKGNGNAVTVTGLIPNTTYHYAIYEYNCSSVSPTFNTVSPATGSQLSANPNASDIITDATYVSPVDVAYGTYQAPALTMNFGNSLGVFGMTLRDGGVGGATDGLATNLTSISISTNGSRAIRAVAIWDGATLISPTNVNGGTADFTIDLSATPIVATDGATTNFELRVTYMAGDFIVDNEQIIFTVTAAVANPAGTLFTDPDAGGPESSSAGDDNRIRVIATSLNIIEGPINSIATNAVFTIEVEAIDGNGTRDLDKSLTISNILGVGTLSAASGLTKPTTDSTVVWTDLIYDTAEDTEFEISDGGGPALTVSTGVLKSEPRMAIFTFTGASGNEATFPADSQPLNMTVSVISRGSNISPSPLSGAFSANNWPGAVDEVGSYYEITLIADPGYAFNVTSAEFDHRRSGTGPDRWEGRTSDDNFVGAQTGTTTGTGVWNRNQDLPVDFVDQDTLTFRLYAYRSGGLGGLGGTWAIDNIEFFGTINDIQAPSFTATFPQYDSVAVDGFDLQINADEATTAYFIVQDPSISAPSTAQVVLGENGNGAAAEASGMVDVTVSDSTFNERVAGLGLLTIYDVYFVLDDGTNQSTVVLLEDVPLSDADTDFASATQPGGTTISSTADNPGDSVAVFSFNVSDLGTADGAPTHVTRLVFNPGGANVAIWQDVIGGARLYNNSQSTSIAISNTSIVGSVMVLDIPLGALTVADGASDQITLSVWLTNTAIDNEVLEFEIGGNAHLNETYSIGSQFNNTLTTLTSNIFTIDVVATQLNITAFTLSIPNELTDIALDVEAVDANGNRDLDESSNVTIALGQGSGTIGVDSPPPTLTQALASGFVVWTNLRYSTNSEFITLITQSGTLLDDTTGVISIGSPSDLIVTTTTTLSSDLTVNNVDIQSPGGNLTISSGITLSVSGDFTIDGVLNGNSGTVNFNAPGNTLQLINGTASAADFYNITVTNNGSAGVRAEIDINLHNTLSMANNSIIDVDGAGDDKNFRIVSTSSYTARIGEMGDGSRINGEVVWQRSLRSGPEGWRYIGIPIKGQTLAGISDDVWIQGVAEIHPSHWTNIGTYSEPIGTTGNNGTDGWIDFTSTANPVNVGVGMKLWQWDNNYSPEQTITLKGLPVVGDGVDNIAGSGESYTFPSASFTPSSLDGGGWNFYANPYPSELDWDNVNSTAFGPEAVYVWNPNTQNYGTYSSTTGVGTGGVSQYVSSGQGFFVKANDGTSVLSMTEASKSSADGNSFLRKSDEKFPQMLVKIISDNNNIDETAITFMDVATNGFDERFDAIKLGAGWVNLSSRIGEDEKVVINAMGESKGVQSIKLNIEAFYFGNYTLEFPKIESFSEGATMRLKDSYLDKVIVINASSEYNFEIIENVPETFGGDRFEIQFVEPVKFRFDDIKAKAGKEFVMPVYADQLSDVLNAKIAMDWDDEMLTFVGIEDAGEIDINDFDLTEVEQGLLSLNADYDLPLELPNDTQLFSIRFKASSNSNEAYLNFRRTSMGIKAIDDIDMPFNTKDVVISILQTKLVGGEVFTYTGQPVNAVNVKVEGDDLLENITDIKGVYSLDTYEQSNYTISAAKPDDSKLNDAVTTLDIIKSRRHMLQIDEFTSPYQIVAADVNISKSLTALDLAQMRKVVLGIDEGFVDGLNWLFIPETFDLSNDPFNFETSVDISLSDQNLDMDFVAVKIGDVNNSWTGENGSRSTNGVIELNLEHLKLADELVEIPIVVSDFRSISGYQFTISWDASQLELYDMENKALDGYFNEQLIDDGILTTMWDEFNGKSVDLDDGTVLFVLRFNPKSEDAKSVVELNSSVTKAVAIDHNLSSIAIKSISANVNIDELRNGNLELFQNVPNPFDQSTDIRFKIAKAGKAKLSIINLLGEIIFVHEQDYDTGVYSVTWNKGDSFRSVSPGVYLYRIESNGVDVVKKMLIK